MAKKQHKTQLVIQMLLFFGILLFLNILANARITGKPLYGYLDITEEKRFTLTEPTRDMLEDLDDVVYIRVLV